MLHAYGKINPFLRVVGRRPDGYTDIETVFLPLELHDDLDFDFNAPETVMECEDPALATSDNLVMKALRLYAEHCGVKIVCRVRLVKRLFVAAGLGGGSSDAAATLLACESHYGLAGAEKLRRMARELGADVPFFLSPKPSLGRGIGDELTELPHCPKRTVLLVGPRFGIRAKWAYEHVLPAPPDAPNLTAAMTALSESDGTEPPSERLLRNDLAAAAFQKFPLLENLRNDLHAFGAAAVGMTGSGPTLFAFSEDPARAERIQQKMIQKYDGALHCVVTETRS